MTRSPPSPRSMRACSRMSGLRSSAMPSLGFPGGGSGCSSCSWPIRRFPMPTYPVSSTFPSGASAPRGDAAWPGSASCCRPHEPSVSASTHRPPAVSTSGKALRTSASRSATKSSTLSGRRAASWAGPTTGTSVPGIRRPCLAGEASTIAGNSVRSTRAWRNRATARDAAP